MVSVKVSVAYLLAAITYFSQSGNEHLKELAETTEMAMMTHKIALANPTDTHTLVLICLV